MLRELNDTQIEDLLKSQLIGRIGCHSDGVTYVVPVNYVYDGINIYCHSAKGMKIDLMQKNPEVCLSPQTFFVFPLHIHRRHIR